MTTHTSSIGHALKDAQQRYSHANPLSYAQHKKASQVLPGGNTRTVLFSDPFPITLTRAQDCRVTSLDGDTYIDYLGEYTAGIYGHSHPALREAVLSALDGGWVRGGHIEQEEVLARLICDRFPSIEKIRFANSGTEANLYALSAARAISGRHKVMVFEGGYHGGVLTFGARPSPLTLPLDFIKAPYNDTEAALSLLDEHADAMAAVILEPMQGAGGCIPARLPFLQALREWTAAHDVLLIFDEVMTSRLSGGGLQQVHGIHPDMTTLGKYIGGGFSFGAFGGRADIMDWFNPTRADHIGHAGTFNNNVFTMTAGAVGLREIFTPARAEALSADGEQLRTRLNAIAQSASFPIQFTGVGSMMNVHMCAGEIRSIRDLTRSNLALRDLFYFDLLELGIWPARRGMLNLSLPMGAVEFDQLEAAVARFVEKRRGIAS